MALACRCGVQVYADSIQAAGAFAIEVFRRWSVEL
jgi:hypothetical protein